MPYPPHPQRPQSVSLRRLRRRIFHRLGEWLTGDLSPAAAVPLVRPRSFRPAGNRPKPSLASSRSSLETYVRYRPCHSSKPC